MPRATTPRLADVTPAFWDRRIAVNLRHQYFAQPGPA
jgi:hypothetical protein